MNTVLRMIDANVNRTAEGLRVLEDYYRFVENNRHKQAMVRAMRHSLRKSCPQEAIRARNVIGDVGLATSTTSRLDNKSSMHQLLKANVLRAQEGLRVLEEALKVYGDYPASKVMEKHRYALYDLEKSLWITPRIQGVYAITQEANYSDTLNQVIMMIEAGVKTIQYRQKTGSDQDMLKTALDIRKMTQDAGVTFIVNDSVSLALAVKADGIHVGQVDMDVTQVKTLAPDLLVGVSTHNQKQFVHALKGQPDYIAIGPIYGTKTKKDVEACDGLNFAKWARANADVPLVAIGGIGYDQVTELKALGIDAYAMISALKDKKTTQSLVKLANKE